MAPFKLPAGLLFSPHHSDLAVLTYATIDGLSGQNDYGPATSGVRWLAARLQVSASGIGKALGQLTRPHTSPDPAVPDSPVYLTSVQRGRQRTALRDVVRAIPRVTGPEESLGTDRPLVSPAAWRLYAAYLWLRHPEHGTVKRSRAELGEMLHRRPATITALTRELEGAGLVATRPEAGGCTVVSPLLELSAEGYAAAVALLQVPVQVAPAAVDEVAGAVDRAAETVDELSTTGACPGRAPVPVRAEHPCLSGQSHKETLSMETLSMETRRRRAAAPAGRGRAGTARAGSVAVRSSLPVASWCGRCASPTDRRQVDPDTGRPGPACPCSQPNPAGVAA